MAALALLRGPTPILISIELKFFRQCQIGRAHYKYPKLKFFRPRQIQRVFLGYIFFKEECSRKSLIDKPMQLILFAKEHTTDYCRREEIDNLRFVQ